MDDVRLPPWAQGDAFEFVRIHREALESDYVSEVSACCEAHMHLYICIRPYSLACSKMSTSVQALIHL